ncbi:hypothetical protein MMC31_007443 [Peltigera leucophlebia]|nr:hypothetical protein [Peltigera leucophlebia]
MPAISKLCRSERRYEYIPPEIFLSILDHLPSEALLPLRTVSKTFLHLITPRIFSEITINLAPAKGDHEQQLMLIKSLSTPSSTVNLFLNSVRKITLYTRCDYWKNEDSILIDGKAFKAVLSEHLAPFLTSLQNLETVDWTHCTVLPRPSLYFVTIAPWLSSLAKLQNVAITTKRDNYCKPTLEDYNLPPLHYFRNLVSLLVSCYSDIPIAYCTREITRAIAASPKLTRFSLRNFDGANHNIVVATTCTSLQTFFGNATIPQLIQLELGHVPLPAAGLSQTLSNRLKSLTISTPTGSRHLDFAWAELFTTLEEMGIKLSQLSVTGMEAAMDEMFSYLISYAGGLHTLEIRDIMMDCQEQEDNAGHRFWDQIVPHHKGSLKELRIYPWYEGEWCYGPETAAAIWQCWSLHQLGIAVRSVNSFWAKDKLSLTSANTAIKALDLREPYGLPEDSAVLILHDFSYVLEKLTLTVTDEASTRAEDMSCLNRRELRGFSTELSAEFKRRIIISKRMDRMLSVLKATSGITQNWPLKVLIAGIQLGGCRDGGSGSGEDGDKRCYQRGKGSGGIP